MAFSTNQITVTGTASINIPNMPTASSLTNIVVFDSSSGQLSYTSSAAIGGGASGSYLPLAGGTMDSGSIINFTNGSALREGLIPHNYGGGISRVCANSKEDQWEDGVRYLIETIGSTNTVVYAESINNVIPDNTYDETLAYAIGSRFKNLVTGIEYICTDAIASGATWLPLQGNTFDGIITALEVDGVSIVSGEFTNLTYVINGNIATVFLQVNLTFGFFGSTGNGWFRPITIPGTTVGTGGIIGIGSISVNPLNNQIYPILIYENRARTYELAGSGAANVPATITYSYQLSNR